MCLCGDHTCFEQIHRWNKLIYESNNILIEQYISESVTWVIIFSWKSQAAKQISYMMWKVTAEQPEKNIT